MSFEQLMSPKFAVNARGCNEARALLFVTKFARNHLGTVSLLPHRVLFSPHQNFLRAARDAGRSSAGGERSEEEKRIENAKLICVSTLARCVGVVYDRFRRFSHAGLGKIASWFTAPHI
jgi:hypothetical protein